MPATHSNEVYEHALLERVKERDRCAFEELYHLYFRRLCGYVLRVVRREEIVEETVNDVMFVVWTDAAKFQGRSRVSSWIFGIAYRRGLKLLSREERLAAEVTEPWAGPTAAEPRQRQELRWSLDKAFAGLSADHRAVVELTYFQDRSYREIANIVGCPVNTVKTRMFHARIRLRRILQEAGFGD